LLKNRAIKYKPHIDGLRAIAVLSVMIYHGFPGYLNGGFLGVDIFFVISGYLITKIILKGIMKNEFSFQNFYYRRIKRILPSLLILLFFASITGALILYPDEYKSLGVHIFGGVTFLSNIILYNEIGYFDIDAQFKPLLHLWSLSIEEQFYLIWPVTLFIFSKKSTKFFRLIIFTFIISFVLNCYLTYSNPALAFYLPFTRLWELMAGAIFSDLELNSNHYSVVKIWINQKPKIKNILSLVSFGLIIIVMFFYNNFDHVIMIPYILIVFSTFLIIAFSEKTIVEKKILSNRILVYIGLISYPLYLWHWPILSFSYIVSNGFPSGEIRLVLIIISFLLSVLTYNYLEKPIRFKSKNIINRRILGGLMSLMICLCLISYLIVLNEGFPERGNNLTKTENTNYKDINKNNIVTNERIIVIGDSHAQQVYQSLELSGFSNIKVFSKGTCFPFLEVNTSRHPTRLWKQETDCQPWVNNSYLEIKNLKDFSTVLITCFYNQYLDARILIEDENLDHDDPIKVFQYGINRTINYLLSLNKNIILALDFPELNGPCMPPRPFIFNNQKNCLLEKQEENLKSIIYSDIIKTISENNEKVYMYDPRGVLCDENNCFGKIDDNYLYNSDGNHLTKKGLFLIGNHFKMNFDSNFSM